MSYKITLEERVAVRLSFRVAWHGRERAVVAVSRVSRTTERLEDDAPRVQGVGLYHRHVDELRGGGRVADGGRSRHVGVGWGCGLAEPDRLRNLKNSIPAEFPGREWYSHQDTLHIREERWNV